MDATATSLALQEQVTFAFEEHVAWHTVGIVCDDGKAIGTGVAVSFAGRNLVITAAHVVQETRPDRISFMFRPPGTLVRAPLPEAASRRHQVAVTPRIEARIADVIADRTLDIALLAVSWELSRERRVRFFELRPDALAPVAGTIVLSKGYPTDCALPMGGQDKLLLSVANSGYIAENPKLGSLDGFDPQQSFVVPYHLAKIAHARGFSGAPAWFQKPTPGIWRPNPGLAGICTNYYRHSGLLSFVRAEKIIGFLQS